MTATTYHVFFPIYSSVPVNQVHSPVHIIVNPLSVPLILNPKNAYPSPINLKFINKIPEIERKKLT